MAKEGIIPGDLKPPYGNIAWYETFFDLIRSRSFERFDREIIELNVIKGSNAGKFFRGLRFLGVVDQDGRTTEKFESLRRKGEEFRENLRKVVEEAYSHLFAKVAVDKADIEKLYNYFSKYYEYGETIALRAIKIFTYLCKEAGVPLSEELVNVEFKPKIPRKQRSERQRHGKERRKTEERVQLTMPGMQKLEYGGDFVLFLRKGDTSTRERIAETAKKFIDIYVKMEEDQP